MSGGATRVPAVREVSGAELDRWDADAVDVPGGHVLQSRAWAAHRAATGWRPLHLALGEERALVLVRDWPLVPGGSAYVPRGPVGPGEPWAHAPGAAGGDPGSGRAIGSALERLPGYLAGIGVDVLAADPEVDAGDAGYAESLARGGFHPIPEIQPSRHRMSLALPADGDGAAVLEGVAKATRQRIRRAERDGVCVVRWDVAPTAVDGTVVPTEEARIAFERFYGLLSATGDRKGFTLGGPAGFTSWWRRAHAAGHLVYLEAREGAADGDVLGGLMLYRHGRRLSTVHSGDRAERRRDHPGAMHLLRWRAIELALAERRTEMDLGGVDVAGARRRPEPGEPTHGLYEHKLSFGAAWVDLAGAQERVIRPWRYAAGRAASKVGRLARRGSGG